MLLVLRQIAKKVEFDRERGYPVTARDVLFSVLDCRSREIPIEEERKSISRKRKRKTYD